MDYPKKYFNQTIRKDAHKLKIQTVQTISRGISNKIDIEDINDQRESSMLSIIA